MLYALAIGEGTDHLEFTTELKGQKVIPTFAVIPGMRGLGTLSSLGDINFAMLVHGEQGITLHADLPPDGKAKISGKITNIWDKGSGASIETESTATTPAGEPLFTGRSTIFIRGEGGFGGERGPSGVRYPVPDDRAPDLTVSYDTLPQQALIYRLCGDMNPLHADPDFAAMGGFDRPILHGLCTYGFTGRALLHNLCDSDASKFGSMDARFSKPVFPGDTLAVSIWKVGDGEWRFRTSTQGGDVVLDGGRFTVR
jgi:acyl dehydratase